MRLIGHSTGILMLATGLSLTAPVGAQYDLSWHTVDGGGAMWTTGGDYELSGTIGQPDANVTLMTGGDFELAGGFWPGIEPFCFGDLDGDGRVGLSDLAQLLANYGETSGMTYADGDLDGDPGAMTRILIQGGGMKVHGGAEMVIR